MDIIASVHKIKECFVLAKKRATDKLQSQDAILKVKLA